MSRTVGDSVQVIEKGRYQFGIVTGFVTGRVHRLSGEQLVVVLLDDKKTYVTRKDKQVYDKENK